MRFPKAKKTLPPRFLRFHSGEENDIVCRLTYSTIVCHDRKLGLDHTEYGHVYLEFILVLNVRQLLRYLLARNFFGPHDRPGSFNVEKCSRPFCQQRNFEKML